MYSLLLMTAMAGGGDAPAFGGRLLGGCHGCNGSVVAYSCFGSSCNGCWGSSCHGASCFGSCYGSSCHGSSCHGTAFLGIRARMEARAASGCHGCWGSSCHGSSCHGCWGSSCHGSSCHGCWGSSCHGCWGATSCHGCTGSVGGSVSYHEGAVIVMPAVGTAKIDPEDDKNQSASLIVTLPAGAKLYVDGQLIPGDATDRRFHTPALVRGKTYYYDMKAELTVAGKPVIEEKKVMVKAGDTVVEKFEKLTTVSTGETGFALK